LPAGQALTLRPRPRRSQSSSVFEDGWTDGLGHHIVRVTYRMVAIGNLLRKRQRTRVAFHAPTFYINYKIRYSGRDGQIDPWYLAASDHTGGTAFFLCSPCTVTERLQRFFARRVPWSVDHSSIALFTRRWVHFPSPPPVCSRPMARGILGDAVPATPSVADGLQTLCV